MIIKENDWRPEETNFRGPVLWMCLSRKVAFVKRIDCTYRSYHRDRTESWIVKKVLKFSSFFLDLENVWKRLSLEKFFFQIYNKCFVSEFFFVFKSYSASSVCLQRTTKKALFLRFKVSVDHLFDNPEYGERNYCFGKSSGKSIEILNPKICVNPVTSSSPDIFFSLFFFLSSTH